MSHMSDLASFLCFCTEDELDGDSDEHKELINSFSLSGSHERQRASSIQGNLQDHSSQLLYIRLILAMYDSLLAANCLNSTVVYIIHGSTV